MRFACIVKVLDGKGLYLGPANESVPREQAIIEKWPEAAARAEAKFGKAWPSYAQIIEVDFQEWVRFNAKKGGKTMSDKRREALKKARANSPSWPKRLIFRVGTTNEGRMFAVYCLNRRKGTEYMKAAGVVPPDWFMHKNFRPRKLVSCPQKPGVYEHVRRKPGQTGASRWKQIYAAPKENEL